MSRREAYSIFIDISLVITIIFEENKSLNSNISELSPLQTMQLIEKYPSLVATIDFEELQASVSLLQENGIFQQEILKHPETLILGRRKLSDRLKVLDECSFRNHKCYSLYDFSKVLWRKIRSLKWFGFIDEKENVVENLISLLGLRIELSDEIIEETSLVKIRELILTHYFKKKFGVPVPSTKLKFRSLKSTARLIDIFQNRLNLKNEKFLITKGKSILLSCPDEISKLLDEVHTIAGIPIEGYMRQQPQLLHFASSMPTTLQHIKSFGIPEHNVLDCPLIFTVPPIEIKKRLAEIARHKELYILRSNPKILRLVFFREKAKSRLDYISRMKMKPTSIGSLVGTLHQFTWLTIRGKDFKKKDDLSFFLARVLNKRHCDIEKHLERHPHYYQIHVTSAKKVLDYLRYKEFTDEEIYENIFILLYPLARVESKLSPLINEKKNTNGTQQINGILVSLIPNSKLLSLCLYYIEEEFHFSGDGVWDPDFRIDSTNEIKSSL